MKIVYLANASIPAGWAHEIQIMKMIEAFVKSGMEVELLVPYRRIGLKDNPFIYYGIKTKFKITKLPCLDIFPGSPNNFIFSIRLLSFLFSARVYLIFKKFDILYTREQLSGFFFNNFALEIHTLPEQIRNWHKKVWQKTKKLIVLTSFIKEKLIKFGIEERKIIIAPDAVDPKEFDNQFLKKEAREKLNLPQDKKIIGYVGMLKTMGMKKGIDVIIEACRYLSDNILLVIVGGTKEDIDEYRDYALRNNLIDRILFVGFVEHKNIPLYLYSFDVAVALFPDNTHYRYYMSPLKIFEYMAAGLPIITTDLPSLREILKEDCAIFIKNLEPKIVADEILKLVNNESLVKKMGEASKDLSFNYTWEERAKRIINFLKEDLDKN